MIKEALEYLIGLGNAGQFEINGQDYSDKPLHLVKAPTALPFTVNTLSGLIDYLKSDFDGENKTIVHVASPTEVNVQSALNGDAKRNYYIGAEASLPEFRFGLFYDTEEFNIKLQSGFVQNEDRDIMLQVVGNIQEEGIKSTGDDGVSQQATIRSGVQTKANVKVPNPVRLKPYRTFVEIEQPESAFVFSDAVRT